MLRQYACSILNSLVGSFVSVGMAMLILTMHTLKNRMLHQNESISVNIVRLHAH